MLPCLSNPGAYKKLAWIEDIAKRKYGPDIFVLGTTQVALNKLKKDLSYHAVSSSRPEERGRAVVDIDCKCHINKAEGKEDESGEQPEDWFDGFEIVSKKGSNESKAKSYQLQLSTSKTKQFGGNLNLKVGGSGFFNMAGSPISPEIGGGIGASYSKTTTEQTTSSESQEQTLSQEYQIVDSLKVPPKTKVKAEITTWAVTYESKTVTELSISATAFLPVYYRTRFSRMIGGIFTSSGVLSAQDIFSQEEDYKCEDGHITFKRHGTVSYLGEEVEITKTKTASDARSYI